MCIFSHPGNSFSYCNKQEAKSHLSFGMCAFSPPKFPINVHFFAATRSRQNHTFPSESALFRLRELHVLTATSKKQSHTFPSECALFRRRIFRWIRNGRSLKTAPSLLSCEYQTIPRALPFNSPKTCFWKSVSALCPRGGFLSAAISFLFFGTSKWRSDMHRAKISENNDISVQKAKQTAWKKMVISEKYELKSATTRRRYRFWEVKFWRKATWLGLAGWLAWLGWQLCSFNS